MPAFRLRNNRDTHVLNLTAFRPLGFKPSAAACYATSNQDATRVGHEQTIAMFNIVVPNLQERNGWLKNRRFAEKLHWKFVDFFDAPNMTQRQVSPHTEPLNYFQASADDLFGTSKMYEDYVPLCNKGTRRQRHLKLFTRRTRTPVGEPRVDEERR